MVKKVRRKVIITPPGSTRAYLFHDSGSDVQILTIGTPIAFSRSCRWPCGLICIRRPGLIPHYWLRNAFIPADGREVCLPGVMLDAWSCKIVG
jgi:hypothetical protein